VRVSNRTLVIIVAFVILMVAAIARMHQPQRGAASHSPFAAHGR
jgi:hypothetical protein